MTLELTPAALRAALDDHPAPDHPALPGRTNHLRAGVMVPIRWQPGPVVLATLRPTTMGLHGGEVCFPGGRPEPIDAGDLWATARREAAEELGLRPLSLLGRLASMPVYTSDYRLVPWVAEVDPDAPLQPAPDEVAEVLEVPLIDLARQEVQYGVGYEWDGVRAVSPTFDLSGHTMFGATAHTLWELVGVVARALGHAPPRLVPGTRTWRELVPG